jgi:hypothetical protein
VSLVPKRRFGALVVGKVVVEVTTKISRGWRNLYRYPSVVRALKVCSERTGYGGRYQINFSPPLSAGRIQVQTSIIRRDLETAKLPGCN